MVSFSWTYLYNFPWVCELSWEGNLNKDVRDVKSIGEILSENRILTVLKYHPENSFSF